MPWPFNFLLKAKPRDLDQFREVVSNCRVRIWILLCLQWPSFLLSNVGKENQQRISMDSGRPVIITISAIHLPSNIIFSPFLTQNLRCLCEGQTDFYWIKDSVPLYTDFQHYKGKRKVKTKLLLSPQMDIAYLVCTHNFSGVCGFPFKPA